MQACVQICVQTCVHLLLDGTELAEEEAEGGHRTEVLEYLDAEEDDKNDSGDIGEDDGRRKVEDLLEPMDHSRGYMLIDICIDMSA